MKPSVESRFCVTIKSFLDLFLFVNTFGLIEYNSYSVIKAAVVKNCADAMDSPI
jgi:hypothetical protein